MRTVVITRPVHQAQPWMKTLEQRGFPVVHIPLLRITSAGEKELIQQAWAQLDEWEWVMFVSPNAAHYFFEHAQGKCWPKHVRAGSPGEGTTQALIKLGIPSELIDQPLPHQEKDTEYLWQNIQHRNWQDKKVLLVRGVSPRPPRDWLMHQLQDAGASVQPLVVYERQSGIFSIEDQNWILTPQAETACWVISSAESLDALIGHDWSKATAIVIHPRIAKAVRQVGFNQVICIQPDIDSLVVSLESVI